MWVCRGVGEGGWERGWLGGGGGRSVYMYAYMFTIHNMQNSRLFISSQHQHYRHEKNITFGRYVMFAWFCFQVHRELSRIKEQFEQPETSVSRWSEAFPRIIFCSVLGYNVSFCHIYAIKLAAQGKGRDKRLGYLAATLLLDPSQEITIMMMGNSIDYHILYDVLAIELPDFCWISKLWLEVFWPNEHFSDKKKICC